MNFTPNNSLAIPHAANTVEILTPNVLKQGDTFNEIRVRLQRENVNVSFTDVTVVWSAAGPNGAIITDRPATIHGNGEISFAFTEEDKGAWGTLRIEFKVTHNVTNKVEKFPANDHVRLHVTRSHDDLTHTPVTFASLSYFNAQVEAAAKSASEASQHALLVEKQGEFAQEQAELAQEAITVATRETDRAAQVSGYLEEKKPLIDKFTGDQTNLQAQVDQLIVEGDSSPAAAQAAVGTDGKVYPTLKARLDTEQKATAQQLADKPDRAEVREKDIPIGENDLTASLQQAISDSPGVPINLLTIPKQGSVNTASTNFAKTGKNIFNKADIYKGVSISNSTGGLISSANYVTSGFIAVSPETQYAIQGYNAHIGFYDSNKEFIRLDLSTVNTFTTPTNCHYVRAVVYSQGGTSSTMLDVFQIEKGTMATAYESYKITIPDLRTDLDNIPSIAGDKIISKSVSAAKLDDALSREITANRKVTTTKHRALVCPPRAEDYAYEAIYQLNGAGIGVELTNLEQFTRHHKEWIKEFDVLVFGYENCTLPYLTKTKTEDIKNALIWWQANGGKLLYHYSSSIHSIRKLGANATVVESSSLTDVIPVSIPGASTAYDGTGSFVKTENVPLQWENIVVDGYPPNGAIRGMSFSTSDGSRGLVKAKEGVKEVTTVMYRPNKYAVVAYGGAIGGIASLPAYRYVDFGLLAKYLIGDTDIKLSMDCRFNKKIAATGVDADLSTEKAPLEMLINSFEKGKQEIGLVTDHLDDDMISYLRSKSGNVEFNSHSSAHMFRSTVVETHFIDENQVVTLKKPYRVSNTEIIRVEKADGTVVFSYAGDWTKAPAVAEYSYDRYAKLLFNASDVGKEIKITYQPIDEPHEWLGSLEKLEALKIMTNRSIYLTGQQTSLWHSTYAYALRNDIIFCDHIGASLRGDYLLYGNSIPKFSPIHKPTLQIAPGLGGFDNALFTVPKEQAKTEFVNLLNRSNRLNEPYVWYSHDYPFSETDSRSIFAGTRFNADWKKSSYKETLTYVEDYFRWMVDYLNSNNVHWEYRSDYSRFYRELNENIFYESKIVENVEYVTIENRGDKKVNGITFRKTGKKPSSVIQLPNKHLEFNYDTELRFYVDLSPGESTTVAIQ